MASNKQKRMEEKTKRIQARQEAKARKAEAKAEAKARKAEAKAETKKAKVEAGTELLRFDKKAIEAAGYDSTVVLAVTNSAEYPLMKKQTGQVAAAGKTTVITF